MNNIITKIAIALGLALILAGSFLFYNGFGIIEAQRGWAEVISGASLIAGGSVVLALAFVLARLDSLANGVRFPESMPISAVRAPLPPVHEDALFAGMDHLAEAPFPAAEPHVAEPQVHEAVAPLETPVNTSAETPSHLGMAPVAAALGLGGAAMMFAHKAADAVHMPPVHNLEVPSSTAAEAPEMPEELPPEPAEVEAALQPDADEDADAPEPVAAEAEPVAPAPVWHLPPTQSVATPPKLDIGDDWFDEALSGKSGITPPTLLAPLVTDAPSEKAVAHEAADPAGNPEAVHEEAMHSPQANGMSEGATPAHQEASDAIQTQPVVARYSAGGIDYVLYQDGSIDSDDGVDILHFASMEHLKEYMETQSRP